MRRAIVQTAEGLPPRNLVGSDLACMFELNVFVKIRKHEWGNKTVAERQAASREFLRRRKCPEKFWPYVHVATDIVMDNDQRHEIVKRYNSRPRDQELDARIATWREELVAERAPEVQRPEAPAPTADQRQQAFQSTRGQGPIAGVLGICSPAARAEQQRQQQLQRYEQTMKRVEREYEKEHGHPYIAYRIWQEAMVDPRYVCFTALNYLKHAPNSPEKNMVAEHPMLTLKNHVYTELRKHRANFELLRKGVTLDDAIDEAVRQCFSGPRGRWHIMRSREKLPCCLQLLAGNKGEMCELKYIFDRWRNYDEVTGRTLGRDYGRQGHPVHDKDKKDTHQERATGGGWISNRSWT
jgi:hypothetical protein